jgi:DNA-binding NarL/FixJ family response regulator
VRTVERHVANIYAKIGAHNRVEATGYAARRGLAGPPGPPGPPDGSA